MNSNRKYSGNDDDEKNKNDLKTFTPQFDILFNKIRGKYLTPRLQWPLQCQTETIVMHASICNHTQFTHPPDRK